MSDFLVAAGAAALVAVVVAAHVLWLAVLPTIGVLWCLGWLS